MERGIQDQEPKFPKCVEDIGEDWEDNADRVNALTYETNYNKPGQRFIRTEELDFCRI
jgi:hypothetical protein